MMEYDLETALRQKSDDWKAYLLIVIPINHGKYTKKISSSTKIFEIDSALFYDLVAQQKTLNTNYSKILDRAISTHMHQKDHRTDTKTKKKPMEVTHTNQGGRTLLQHLRESLSPA